MRLNTVLIFLAAPCLALSLTSCATSPERQAKLDEIDRTIPGCTSSAECGPKWAAARAWVIENSDFGIRGESEDRIMATSNIISTSGLGAVVNRVPVANGYQIVVDLECFATYGCPDILDSTIDFNRTVNAAR